MKLRGRSVLFVVLWAVVCSQFAYSVETYVFGRMDIATGTLPNGIATSDFNGAGKQDFAVANSGDNTVSTFIQASNGMFARTDYAVGSEPDA